MMAGIGHGLFMVVTGGFVGGSFALPMRRNRWPWENSWLLFSVSGLVIMPWAVALGFIPHLSNIYAGVPQRLLVEIALFGLVWGIGATLCGLGMNEMGLAVGYSIVVGIAATLGSLIPLAILHPEQLLLRKGQLLITGTAVMLIGLAFLAVAGHRRERDTSAIRAGASSRVWLGLAICVLAGIFSSLLNFSFNFDVPLQRLTLAGGAKPYLVHFATWPIATSAGFIVNAGYCAYLLKKNHTVSNFVQQGRVGAWVGGILMGVLWFGGNLIYTMGAATMGPLGAIVGWPIAMGMNVLAAYCWGVLNGEWKGASLAARAYSWAAAAALMMAIYVVSLGNSS
jgi:L-rhamnose-H+ transport protein